MDDDMKKTWRDMRMCPGNGNNYNDIFNGRRRTALQRLAERYRRFSNLALAMLMWCPLMLSRHLFPLTERIWVVALMAVFLVTASVMDRWLYHGIRGIDCSTMTVSEVVRLAVFYRRRHIQFVMILLPMVLSWIGLMAWLMLDDVYFVWGMVTGLLIGSAVGLRKFFDFMADYRDIRAE